MTTFKKAGEKYQKISRFGTPGFTTDESNHIIFLRSSDEHYYESSRV
jgi:hypothetical protein